MWRCWPQATNFMGYQPLHGPGNRLFKIMAFLPFSTGSPHRYLLPIFIHINVMDFVIRKGILPNHHKNHPVPLFRLCLLFDIQFNQYSNIQLKIIHLELEHSMFNEHCSSFPQNTKISYHA